MRSIGAGTLLYGIQQRQNTINDINIIINKQSQKLQLLTLMKSAARERSLCLFNMVSLDDLFERDGWFLKFNRHGTQFATARMQLITLSNTQQEKEFLQKQGKRSNKAISTQQKSSTLCNLIKLKKLKPY